MEIFDDIGLVAGTIWQYLDQHGDTNTIQIKVDLGYSNTQIFLGLGWLLREDKIQLTRQNNITQVKLIK